MSVRAKGSLGKLSGVATITRKDGTKEEVPVTAKVPKERVEKFINSQKSKK